MGRLFLLLKIWPTPGRLRESLDEYLLLENRILRDEACG